MYSKSYTSASSLLADRANTTAASRPKPLSSQPKRKWGDDDSSQPTKKPDIDITEEDWPPSPPKAARTASGSRVGAAKGDSFTGGVTSHSATTTGAQAGGSAWSNSRGSASNISTSRVPAAKPLAPSRSFRTEPPSSKVASLFRPSTASSSSRPATASTSAAPLAPAKRAMPWDNLAAAGSKQVSRTGSGTFHNLSGPGTAVTGSKGKAGTLDIIQQVVLSPEQQQVLKLVVDDGQNVFFTGSAGTGKSVLLREIIKSLKRKYSSAPDVVAVVASTGMAACNIGGTTIHSWSGIGIGVESAEALIAAVKKKRESAGRWIRAKVLVIDEVSMVDAFLFDKLAAIAAALKKNSLPFGGIQLIVTGDFFQLPPVTKGGSATFAFEATSWKKCIAHTVNLTQVFRQRDTEFIDMLNEMRFGTLTPASIAKFKELKRDPCYQDGIDPTELFPRREEVDAANKNRIRSLPGDMVTFKAEDWTAYAPPGNKPNSILANFMAPELLTLKIGAQVMLIKNMDATLVNGTVGKVTGFGFPEMNEDEEASLDPEERKRIRLARSGEQPPQITWNTPNGKEVRMMAREEFKTENNKGEKQATRKQYPIILAWAMSIHKSQGQTLPRVKVNLGKVFEKGQSYVALSRATSLAGLQVLNFEASKVAAHPKVVAWSKNLQVLDPQGRR